MSNYNIWHLRSPTFSADKESRVLPLSHMPSSETPMRLGGLVERRTDRSTRPLSSSTSSTRECTTPSTLNNRSQLHILWVSSFALEVPLGFGSGAGMARCRGLPDMTSAVLHRKGRDLSRNFTCIRWSSWWVVNSVRRSKTQRFPTSQEIPTIFSNHFENSQLIIEISQKIL